MVIKSKLAKLVLIQIGPDNINEELAKCKSNRNKTRRHVNTFVRLIKQGNFRDGGFIFADSQGNYHDAQHRLTALKLTKHTATFWVVTGLDKTDLDMMIDSGKKRTNAQRLASTGIVNAALICGAIEEILEITEHWKRTVDQLMPDEILGYLNANRDLEDLAQAWAKSGIRDINRKILVALQHLVTKINEEVADKFFAGITHRANLKAGEPLYAFFRMLESETIVNDENLARVSRYVRNGLIIAWNAMLKGESLDHITPTERPITLDGTPVADAEPLTLDGGESDDDDDTNGGGED